MKKIDADQLDFGKPLPFDLCNEQGKVIIPANQILEPIDLYLSQDKFEGDMYARPVEKPAHQESPSDTSSVSPARDSEQANPAGVDTNASPFSTSASDTGIRVRSLEPGQIFPHALHEQSGQLLLPANTAITDQFIQLLSRRGVRKVFPPKEQTQRKRDLNQHNDPRDGLGQATRAQRASGAARKLDDYQPEDASPSPANRPKPKTSVNASTRRETVAAAEETFKQSADRYQSTAQALAKGQSPDFYGLKKHLSDLQTIIQGDQAVAALLLSFEGGESDYLYKHGCNAAALTMMIANEMGHTKDEIREAGLGALLQDVGMMQVPEEIRSAKRKLTAKERMEIERHPIYTVNTLEKHGISNRNTLMVSYQCHERCDRSGYPRRRHRMFIHPLARVAAVADTYAALITPRPYRDALSPYEAMAVVLKEVRAGRLDPDVVRAFLDAMSVFPVGSYVLLSNGAPAQVVKATPKQHCKPIVAPLDEQGQPQDEWIDLAKQSELSIAEAIHDIKIYLAGQSKAA